MKNEPLLLLDCGNSAVKCQLVSVPSTAPRPDEPALLFDLLGSSPIARIDNANASVEGLLAAWKNLGMQDIEPKLQLSWLSVGPQAVQQAVRTAFQQVCGTHAPEPWQPSACTGFNGLGINQFLNRYAQPAQLGADRWASALGLACQGLISPGETQMIVSAGTATTIDLVRFGGPDAKGSYAEFLGGWILPGIGLMKDSLRTKTRDLDSLMAAQPPVHAQASAPTDMHLAIPTSTHLAISQGIGLAQTGFIRQIAQQHQAAGLWLHGGHAETWKAYLSGQQENAGGFFKVHEAFHLAFAGLLALKRYRV